MTNQKFSHVDKNGKANMVDVGAKPPQKRVATASGMIQLSPGTVKLIRENEIKKGDVITVAEIAGIQAAKQTPFLVPLCHNLLLTQVKVKCHIVKTGVHAESTVQCNRQTGLEMEALTAVSVALLTVYDMCKAVDKKMVIGEITLTNKTKTDIG